METCIDQIIESRTVVQTKGTVIASLHHHTNQWTGSLHRKAIKMFTGLLCNKGKSNISCQRRHIYEIKSVQVCISIGLSGCDVGYVSVPWKHIVTQ